MNDLILRKKIQNEFNTVLLSFLVIQLDIISIIFYYIFICDTCKVVIFHIIHCAVVSSTAKSYKPWNIFCSLLLCPPSMPKKSKLHKSIFFKCWQLVCSLQLSFFDHPAKLFFFLFHNVLNVAHHTHSYLCESKFVSRVCRCSYRKPLTEVAELWLRTSEFSERTLMGLVGGEWRTVERTTRIFPRP